MCCNCSATELRPRIIAIEWRVNSSHSSSFSTPPSSELNYLHLISVICNEFMRYFHQSRISNVEQVLWFIFQLANWMFWTSRKFVFFFNCSNWEKMVKQKLVKKFDKFIIDELKINQDVKGCALINVGYGLKSV